MILQCPLGHHHHTRGAIAHLTGRGGGTSQCGQTVNSGLILDNSKYFNRILEIDVEGRRVVVGPKDMLATRRVPVREVNWLGDGPFDRDGERAIYILELNKLTVRKLTEGGESYCATWSPLRD